jgi:hypothetical protein
MSETDIMIGLSAVVVAVEDHQPKVFIVRSEAAGEAGDALPFGHFDPARHATLELGLRAWVSEQTPLEPGYVEQLYTFGNKGRYAGQKDEKKRVISIGYLALTWQEYAQRGSEKIFFGSWYDYFPWEDWRAGKPAVLTKSIEPGLKRWIGEAQSAPEKSSRRARASLCFGLEGVVWDDEKVLERYELLYEARLVPEAIRDKELKKSETIPGRSMLYDHRRILATAMGRLRGKLKYRPVVFELMPPEFTLLNLQKTVEAIVGHLLHKQNFRRLVESSGMVEEVTGRKSTAAGGRPAALFRFRREVLLERTATGVKMSAVGG